MKVGRYLPGFAAVSAFVVVLAAAVCWNIPVSYQIFLPAPAEAIDAHIAVAKHPRQSHRGSLYITFVYEQQANALSKFYEGFNSDATILSDTEVFGGPAPPAQQQQQQSAIEMIDSKTEAEVAAYTALGYHPRLTPEVAVLSIDPHSKAVGILQVDDVIIAVNDHVIQTTDQLITVVRALRPGSPVSLVVNRVVANVTRTLHLTVTTYRSSQTKKTAIGIGLYKTVKASLPYAVSIDSGDIGGPSAGLMFALGIMNRLSPVDLTHGHRIAGTGTIDIFGNVGPIGGAKQKVIGARQSGAQYMFVPAYCDASVCNYKEAKPYAKGITLVPVNTLAQALAFLRHLR